MSPNLIERLENLIAALNEAREENDNGHTAECGQRIDDADGIAGELLTMIDGR